MRSDWHKDLKVGDKVITESSYSRYLRITKVKKITKTMIVLDSGDRFNKISGFGVGEGWRKPYLIRYTSENRDKAIKQKLVAKIQIEAEKLNKNQQYDLKILSKIYILLEQINAKL